MRLLDWAWDGGGDTGSEGSQGREEELEALKLHQHSWFTLSLKKTSLAPASLDKMVGHI